MVALLAAHLAGRWVLQRVARLVLHWVDSMVEKTAAQKAACWDDCLVATMVVPKVGSKGHLSADSLADWTVCTKAEWSVALRAVQKGKRRAGLSADHSVASSAGRSAPKLVDSSALPMVDLKVYCLVACSVSRWVVQTALR